METEAVALPEDALAGVFRRLPPLLPHQLPRSVRGIFINYIDHGRPHLFARPSSSTASPPATSPEIDGLLSFMPNDPGTDWWSVMDHCDGLLLCSVEWERRLCVCNPATQRWALLPPPRAEAITISRYAGACLAFDPAVSPHHEVVLLPDVPRKPMRPDSWKVQKKRPRRRQQEIHEPFCLDSLFASLDGTTLVAEDTTHGEEFQRGSPPPQVSPDLSMDEEDREPDDPCRLMEWPPSPFRLDVFSSRTGQWEDRSFVREGESVGTVEDMRLDVSKRMGSTTRRRCAVFRQRVLYVHYHRAFIMRLALSDGKYRLIKTPTDADNVKPYLGRLAKEVCFGIVREGHLRVWVLIESGEKAEWVLRYQDDLRHCAHHSRSLYRSGTLMAGPWTIIEENNVNVRGSDDKAETLTKENLEWDSDNDDILSVDVRSEESYWGISFDILGFHPYKKVVYLTEPFGVLAYHLNTSNVQYLGNSRPKCYYRNYSNGIYESFVYTPCMIRELQEDNISW
ncbi:hypothetical protein SEVIR_7G154000v4 [Setaria viridis]|nr:uncharacterized protein LOC117865127 [Setaria viridis]